MFLIAVNMVRCAAKTWFNNCLKYIVLKIVLIFSSELQPLYALGDRWMDNPYVDSRKENYRNIDLGVFLSSRCLNGFIQRYYKSCFISLLHGQYRSDHRKTTAKCFIIVYKIHTISLNTSKLSIRWTYRLTDLVPSSILTI